MTRWRALQVREWFAPACFVTWPVKMHSLGAIGESSTVNVFGREEAVSRNKCDIAGQANDEQDVPFQRGP